MGYVHCISRDRRTPIGELPLLLSYHWPVSSAEDTSTNVSPSTRHQGAFIKNWKGFILAINNWYSTPDDWMQWFSECFSTRIVSGTQNNSQMSLTSANLQLSPVRTQAQAGWLSVKAWLMAALCFGWVYFGPGMPWVELNQDKPAVDTKHDMAISMSCWDFAFKVLIIASRPKPSSSLSRVQQKTRKLVDSGNL